MASKPKTFIYDINTRNISFLQTSVDLKNLGIKNNMFFLKLYDQGLQKVDPFNPLLPEEMIMRIINECLINPWYFLRECARIPEQGGTGIPYQLNRGNLAATFCFLMGIDHYLVLPRQKGKTQSTIAELDWAFLFGTTNSEFMFLNKSQEDANNNLQRLKDQRDLLPPYMQLNVIFDEETGKQLKETDNVKSLMSPLTKNKIVAKPSATSVERAENIGRGCTQPIQYYDEVEFTKFIKTIAEAAGPAFNTASRNAKRNGAAYCRIFTSTPGDLDTQAGQDAQLIIKECAMWSEKMYDWTKQQIEDYVATNSRSRIVYIEYQYTQLGDDEEWFQKACQSVFNNPAKIKREIFLKRMRGSSQSPFDMEDLEALQDLKGSIKEEIFINQMFKLDIYEPLDRSIPYLIGVDVAHGLGDKDSTAVTLVNPYTLTAVAEFKSPYIGIVQTQKFLYTLVKKYTPRAILCIERNLGHPIIDALRETDIRGRLYFDTSKEFVGIDDTMDDQGFLKQEASKRRLFGVWISKSSRDTMISILDRHMKEFKEKFVTTNIISDIFSLVIKRSGKIEHAEGFHDDSLFSYLMCLYVYYHGNNLERFGYVKGYIPGQEDANKGLTFEEAYDEMPEEMKQSFTQSKSIDEYYANIRTEIERTRKEMAGSDAAIGAINRVENFEDDLEDESIPLDFFDELNK